MGSLNKQKQFSNSGYCHVWMQHLKCEEPKLEETMMQGCSTLEHTFGIWMKHELPQQCLLFNDSVRKVSRILLESHYLKFNWSRDIKSLLILILMSHEVTSYLICFSHLLNAFMMPCFFLYWILKYCLDVFILNYFSSYSVFWKMLWKQYKQILQYHFQLDWKELLVNSITNSFVSLTIILMVAVLIMKTGEHQNTTPSPLSTLKMNCMSGTKTKQTSFLVLFYLILIAHNIT